METLILSHHDVALHYALFSIQNASSLRTRLIQASTLPKDEQGDLERDRLNFAFIDAAMVRIPSKAYTCPCQAWMLTHCLGHVSFFSTDYLEITSVDCDSQALIAKANATQATHTIHSEVLFCLEPGTNISDSLKHFGLSTTTKYLCLVHITPISHDSLSSINENGKTILKKMQDLVEGELLRIDQLGHLPEGAINEKGLRKLYKLNQDPIILQAETNSNSAASAKALDELCTAAVALKVVA